MEQMKTEKEDIGSIKPILVSKITFTFPERFYIKYDIFELEGVKYICISKPRKLESGEWCIDVFPVCGKIVDDPLESIWKDNTVARLYQ